MRLTRAADILVLVLLTTAPLPGQAPDDGRLLAHRVLSTGIEYAHESWSRYWEGTLARDNGNIGTLTTQHVAWVAGYGLTDRLTLLAAVPYVWTHASQGPLHGMRGVQDVTLAAKYELLATPFTDRGTVHAIVVATAGVPASDYTPDFLPLSIGLASRCFSGRLALNFQAHTGWFLYGSAAYTWRSNVKLDRSAYYTNGQLVLSNEVAMPDVVDYTVSAGWQRGRITLPLALTQQRTLGGGDIRRQDMPFVSNRMDFVRVGGTVMYDVPGVRAVTLSIGASRVVSGRNVGQTSALTAGVHHAVHF
jgi:hypothetical protein